MTNNKPLEILTKHENGTLKIGEAVNIKEEIEKYPLTWMDFNDSKKYELFKETVENNKKFKDLVHYFKERNIEDSIDLTIDNKLVEDIAKRVSKLEAFEKYIAMEYVGAEFGIENTLGSGKKEEIISSIKSGDVKFPGRISDWWQENPYIVAKAFGLENMFSSWDGETALIDAIRPSGKTGYGETVPGWDIHWHQIADNYLLEKGAIQGNQKDKKKELESILKIDEKLVKLRESTGMSDKQLKEYLNVENLYKSYPSFQTAAQIMQNASYNKDGVFVKIGSFSDVQGDEPMPIPLNPDFLKTPEDVKVWNLGHNRVVMNRQAVKTYSAGLSVVNDGKIIGNVEFPPYFIYEDFEGGKSIRHNEFRVNKIVGVDKTKDELTVNYINGNDTKVSMRFKI